MDADELRDRQGPLKERYRAEPESGLVRMQARGTVNLQTLTCHVASRVPSKPAGLHPAAGGDGQAACSGDMLLDALVACSGVTLAAVATAMQLRLELATLAAEAILDFRGTLGIDRAVPVGFQSIQLQFELSGSADDSQLNKLVDLTERYCVVLKTLNCPVTSKWQRGQ